MDEQLKPRKQTSSSNRFLTVPALFIAAEAHRLASDPQILKQGHSDILRTADMLKRVEPDIAGAAPAAVKSSDTSNAPQR